MTAVWTRATVRLDERRDLDARYLLHRAVCTLWDGQTRPVWRMVREEVEAARRVRSGALALREQAIPALAVYHVPQGRGCEAVEPVAWLVERRGVGMSEWRPTYVYLGEENAKNVAN